VANAAVPGIPAQNRANGDGPDRDGRKGRAARRDGHEQGTVQREASPAGPGVDRQVEDQTDGQVDGRTAQDARVRNTTTPSELAAAPAPAPTPPTPAPAAGTPASAPLPRTELGLSEQAAEIEGGRHRRPLEQQASYREVFAIGEFRALFTAQVLSYAGDQFAQVAIAILVYTRTHSAFLTALAYALTYLPPIVGGPLLSGLADLFPRRRIMIVCDLVRAVLVAGMATPGVPFAVLCVLVFGTVLLGAPFTAARSALLPDVLPGDKFVLGSAIGNISFQASQILGFVAGAAVVAVVNPSRTLALDALTFLISALIVITWVKRRPAPPREDSSRLSLWEIAREGAALVFRNPMLRSLVLFGWLAGFYILPEGLAAPYAYALGGHTLDVGLLMAAMPVGTVIGGFVFSRLMAPSTRIRVMGWLAMLSCAPLIGSAANPPLVVVLVLWALAGVGGAYQLAAAAAFVQSVPDSGRARAFGLAQSGLLAMQGLGILIGGAAAQAIGPHLVVALSGLLGLTSATLLALGWTHRRVGIIADMRARSESAQDS
jgi:MFS family permease